MGIGKILVGAILMIASIYYIFYYAWKDVITVINGVIAPLIFLIGLFVVWLEMDEMRVESEIKSEEKSKKKK